MIDRVPLWLIGIGLFVLLMVASELGFRLNQRTKLSSRGETDFLVSAVMGLLALLLGFTFSLALQRHEERRTLVIAEANAIGTSWLRINALDPAGRDEVAEEFRSYADTRLKWSLVTDEGLSSSKLLERGIVQQEKLWRAAVNALADGERVVDPKLLLDPLNESFDLASEREMRRLSHLPPALLTILLLYLVLSTVMMGWRIGEHGRRMILPSGLTLFLLTLAVTAVLDLDHARAGAITVSQQPMADTIEPILASSRTRF